MVKILIDIDGVLNPFLAEASRLPQSFIPVQEGWASWLLDFDQHRTWLMELEQVADLVWASNWAEESNIINKRFGLDALTYPHVDFKTMPDGPGTWKLPAIEAYLKGSDEPVAWLDDEFQEDAHQWAAARPNTLLIECDPATGWTPSQYAEVMEFVRAHPKALRLGGLLGRLNAFRSRVKGRS